MCAGGTVLRLLRVQCPVRRRVKMTNCMLQFVILKGRVAFCNAPYDAYCLYTIEDFRRCIWSPANFRGRIYLIITIVSKTLSINFIVIPHFCTCIMVLSCCHIPLSPILVAFVIRPVYNAPNITGCYNNTTFCIRIVENSSAFWNCGIIVV